MYNEKYKEKIDVIGEKNREETIKVAGKSRGIYLNSIIYAFTEKEMDRVIVRGLGGANAKVFDITDKIVNTMPEINTGKTEIFEDQGLQGVEVELVKGRA